MGKTSKKKGQAAKTKSIVQANRVKAKLDALKRKGDLLKARAPKTQSDDDSDSDDDAASYKRVKTDPPKINPAPTNPAPITPTPPAVPHAVVPVLPTTRDNTVVGQVTEYVKTYLFRHKKFIRNNHEVDSACKEVWKELQKANHWKEPPYNLSLVCFITLYGAIIMRALTAARQYQFASLKAKMRLRVSTFVVFYA